MTPLELVWAHRYSEAAAEFEELLKASPDDPALLGWHAITMLCLGRLPEALEEERRLDRQENAGRNTTLGRSDGHLLTMGGVLLLLGRQAEAIDTFRSAVDGILDGSIKYGDAAGAVSQGLLLWHSGVSARDTVATDQALAYLKNRAARRAIKFWPGPLAQYVLGAASTEDVLLAACGTRYPERAVRMAQDDLLKRRQLVQALLCFATRSRDQGSERECIATMRTCAGLENPIIQIEWYLARGEVERSGPPPSEPEPERRRGLFALFRRRSPET